MDSSPGQPICCALSDYSIQLYDRETLRKIHHIPNAHDRAITDLSSIQKQDPDPSNCNSNHVHLIASSGEDGFVKIFDARLSNNIPTKAATQIRAPQDGEEVLNFSAGYDGNLFAVGTDKAQIHFYDVRNPSVLLGSYVDAHTEEVTCVKFQSSTTSSTLLLTASEDGLINIHDTCQATEETSLNTVLNILTPIRKAGFFGPNLEGVYCLTGSETLSVHHHDSAQPINDFGGLQLRETLTTSIQSAFPIQYLADCHWDGQNLSLLAGSYDGLTAAFQVNADSITPTFFLNNGHKGGIRAFDWNDSVDGANDCMIVTGGEDARLCQWTSSKAETSSFVPSYASNNSKNSAAARGAKARKKKKKHAQSHSPY